MKHFKRPKFFDFLKIKTTNLVFKGDHCDDLRKIVTVVHGPRDVGC